MYRLFKKLPTSIRLVMITIMETQQKLAQKIALASEMGLILATGNESQIDFSGLAEESRRQPNVLPVTEHDLEVSFRQGMSAIFLAGERAVGHARFVPLLDQTLHTGLSMSPDIPQIWEMGTGLMLDECRGLGINLVLRHALVQRYREQMAQGDLLVIATTKTPELRTLVDKMSRLFLDPQDPYPIDFRFINREAIPLIAPFTCVCTPDFGSGYQLGNECSQAEIWTPETEGYRTGTQLPIIGQEEKSRLACTVFVSSSKLAVETNTNLAAKFGTRSNVVNTLQERGYF